MPPPPPPSKSYLLVLDTDSEDEVEEPSPPLQNPPRQKESLEDSLQASTLIAEANGDDDDDDDDEGDSSSQFDSSSNIGSSSNIDDSSPSKKKKRRRKRHRKKQQTSASSSEKEKQTNSVSFDTVSVRYVERELGGDGVPADGGWPLGLKPLQEESSILEEESTPIDDYEGKRRAALELRWKAHSGHAVPHILETRQWDYKKDRDSHGISIRNPLFQPLTEDQRHNLLVHGTKSKRSTNLSSSPKKPDMMRRLRSRSIDQTSDLGHYDPVDVRHVRNELEDLRVERSKEQGCSCRKLHVNLPSAGKKKNRMSFQKVKEELRKRQQLPSIIPTRENLEHLLYNIVQDEPCCTNNDCACFRNNVSCQADSCSCWTHTNEKATTVKEIQDRCGNGFGMYVVDAEAIAKSRKDVIAACQFVDGDN